MHARAARTPFGRSGHQALPPFLEDYHVQRRIYWFEQYGLADGREPGPGKCTPYPADAAAGIAEALAQEHGVRARSEQSPWSGVDVFILMLPTSDIVEAALFNDGVAAALRQGALVIDMSSSEPHRSRDVGDTLDQQGVPVGCSENQPELIQP